MDDLLSDFLAEAAESLALLDHELVRLERDPNDPERLGRIFRVVHTIKGTGGFLGLTRPAALAHAVENVLDRIRGGAVDATPAAISLILEALDRIGLILADRRAGGPADPAADDDELIRRLDRSTPGPAEAMAATVLTTARPAAREVAPAPQTIRVEGDRLDALAALVGELVATRDQLFQILRGHRKSALAAPLERLSRITAELHEAVLATRMQPIGSAWAGLPRLVRDLGHALGKDIELRMLGADIELDRCILERIRDPLVHIVRNAADHGIEPAAERVARGKPAAGTITLHAYRRSGDIVVAIGDDGYGLPMAKIARQALVRGLVTEAALARMTDEEICGFIFAPGFSTAPAITGVSGRGVGMDVVRANIEAVGGAIEVASRAGQGTCFTIAIALERRPTHRAAAAQAA